VVDLVERRWRRRVVRWGGLLLALLVTYVGMTFMQVWQASGHDEARPADAIVVLGAAQYDGRPSPVLAARLDHAADLFREGLAPRIVVTGGRQPGDRFTEAEASANYLASLGVPGDAIERETSSTNSWESLAATSRFLRAEGIEAVILVSDPYHSFRIDAIADELGLDAYVSPTPTSPVDGMSEFRAMLRETAAVSLGRLVGYRRLVRIS
jgi:uncharacterized SAM-binding protein YcdF (DUF218 family)